MKKLISNIVYQGIYQVLVMALPIVTIPIVSQALGPSGVGTYNYANSIVSYFVLLAGLGMETYAAREIAMYREDKNKLSEKFWSLQKFNFLMGTLVLILFLLLVKIFQPERIYMILSLTIVGSGLDITWFFRGIEDFKQIMQANLLIKFIGLILVILFIQQPSDLYLYVLIQATNVLLSSLVLWIFLIGKINFFKIPFKSSINHFKPAFSFFIGKIGSQLYTSLNITILGIMTTTTLVGYYTNSVQLISILYHLIGTLDLVLLPRVSNLLIRNDIESAEKILNEGLHIGMYLSIPAMFGIIAVNEKLVGWFFGEEFNFIIKIVPLMAPLVVIVPLGSAIIRLYELPNGNTKEVNQSVLLGGIVGILTNILLIPSAGIYGSVISYILSHSVVTLYRIFRIYKNTSFKFHFRTIFMQFMFGFFMYLIILLLTKNLPSSIKTTLSQIIVGVLSYFVMTTIFKENYILKVVNKLKL